MITTTERAQAFVQATTTEPHGKCRECWECNVPTVLGLCARCYLDEFPGLFA